jgi:dCMP deaminase|tara:strand:- start:179 stop:586 length:408 start_codon:yes stop_codon:yes gene_type:complete
MDRPNWNEYFKEIIQVTKKRSPCKRLQVGCILVNENRIIAQGYNGYLPECPHESIMENGHEVGTIHAEQNAIIDCAKRGVSCNNSIAYITHYPCFNCMKLLCASGIKQINYIDDYNNNENVIKLSNLSNVEIIKI